MTKNHQVGANAGMESCVSDAQLNKDDVESYEILNQGKISHAHERARSQKESGSHVRVS